MGGELESLLRRKPCISLAHLLIRDQRGDLLLRQLFEIRFAMISGVRRQHRVCL
jgi:hypothetical protein